LNDISSARFVSGLSAPTHAEPSPTHDLRGLGPIPTILTDTDVRVRGCAYGDAVLGACTMSFWHLCDFHLVPLTETRASVVHGIAPYEEK